MSEFAFAISERNYEIIDLLADNFLRENGWEKLRQEYLIGFRDSKITLSDGKLRDSLIHLLDLESTSGIDCDMLELFKNVSAQSLADLRTKATPIAMKQLRKQIRKGNTFFIDIEKLAQTRFASLAKEIIEVRIKEVQNLQDNLEPRDLIPTYYGFQILTAGSILSASKDGELPRVVANLQNLLDSVDSASFIKETKPIISRELFSHCSVNTAILLTNLAIISIYYTWPRIKRILDTLGKRGDSRAIPTILRRLKIGNQEEIPRIVNALEEIGSPEAVDDLYDVYLKQTKANGRRILKTLGKIPSVRTGEILLDLLGRGENVDLVVESLGRMKYTPAFSVILKSLDNALSQKKHKAVIPPLLSSISFYGEIGRDAIKERLPQIDLIVKRTKTPGSYFRWMSQLYESGDEVINNQIERWVSKILHDACSQTKEEQHEFNRKVYDYEQGLGGPYGSRYFESLQKKKPIGSVQIILQSLQDMPYELDNAILLKEFFIDIITKTTHSIFELRDLLDGFPQYASSDEIIARILYLLNRSENLLLDLKRVYQLPELYGHQEFLELIDIALKDLPEYLNSTPRPRAEFESFLFNPFLSRRNSFRSAILEYLELRKSLERPPKIFSEAPYQSNKPWLLKPLLEDRRLCQKILEYGYEFHNKHSFYQFYVWQFLGSHSFREEAQNYLFQIITSEKFFGENVSVEIRNWIRENLPGILRIDERLPDILQYAAESGFIDDKPILDFLLENLDVLLSFPKEDPRSLWFLPLSSIIRNSTKIPIEVLERMILADFDWRIINDIVDHPELVSLQPIQDAILESTKNMPPHYSMCLRAARIPALRTFEPIKEAYELAFIDKKRISREDLLDIATLRLEEYIRTNDVKALHAYLRKITKKNEIIRFILTKNHLMEHETIQEHFYSLLKDKGDNLPRLGRKLVSILLSFIDRKSPEEVVEALLSRWDDDKYRYRILEGIRLNVNITKKNLQLLVEGIVSAYSVLDIEDKELKPEEIQELVKMPSLSKNEVIVGLICDVIQNHDAPLDLVPLMKDSKEIMSSKSVMEAFHFHRDHGLDVIQYPWTSNYPDFGTICDNINSVPILKDDSEIQVELKRVTNLYKRAL